MFILDMEYREEEKKQKEGEGSRERKEGKEVGMEKKSVEKR